MKYKTLFSVLLSLSTLACSPLPITTEQANRFLAQKQTVIDTRSDLMWSRCLLGASWNGTTCEGRPTQYGWQEIHDLVKTLNYAGYSDWRVPTLEELKSLAVRKSSPPELEKFYLDNEVFPIPNCQGKQTAAGLNSNGHICWHWTDSPIEGSRHYAWILYFGYGYGSANYEADTFPLRLVRNAD